ncbi:MAG: cation transporter [Hyphomicrobiales bacterium]|nr:cation transporter [Hyphomicrobiales bacterium]
MSGSTGTDVKLVVGGMACEGCVASVKKVLERVPGVTAAEVSLEPGVALVSGSAKAGELIKAVEAAGYEAKAA